MMRLNVLGVAAAVAGGLVLSTAAQAAPFVPGPVGASEDAQVEKVGYYCGPGFRLSRFGVCKPVWGPRPFYRPYGYGYYRPRPYYRPYGFYGPRPFF